MIPGEYITPLDRYSKKNPVPAILKKRPESHRGIYAIEFPNRRVIVGLTNDYLRRMGWYRRFPFSKEFSKGEALVKLFCVWHPKAQAAVEEGLTAQAYRDAGWIVLNVRPTGGLGSGGRRRKRDPDYVPVITCFWPTK